MTAQAQIRDATDADFDRITAIYAHYVRTSVITFEIEPPDRTEMARRWAGIRNQALPYLVAEAEGTVIGFAYAAPFRTRHAYRFTVEDTVYLDPGVTGRGTGKRLLSKLIDRCTAGNFRQMIGIVAGQENTASIQLHKSLGFEMIGTTCAVGYKFDRWIDTLHLQRALGDGSNTPP